jgi:nucleoside-diphosphate-sugar epimerase
LNDLRMNKDDRAIVFGAGPLGSAVARELYGRGKRVRIISRRGTADVPDGVEVARGDVSNPSGIRHLCKEASAIYHCASPPYSRWLHEFPAIHAGVLDCAAFSRSRLIMGDNLYLYGPVQGKMTEESPPNPPGEHGRLRKEMAEQVLDAHRQGKFPATVGRASDFFGPGVLTSHMGERVFPAALSGKPAQMLGNPDMPHTFTYIKDFARALVTLGESEKAFGQIWHVPSGETLTTRQFIELVSRECNVDLSIKTVPRSLVTLLALFSPLMRALKEQLYQFERPFIVDHSKFVKSFGDTSTPHPVAIRETVDWYRTRSRSR